MQLSKLLFGMQKAAWSMGLAWVAMVKHLNRGSQFCDRKKVRILVLIRVRQELESERPAGLRGVTLISVGSPDSMAMLRWLKLRRPELVPSEVTPLELVLLEVRRRPPVLSLWPALTWAVRRAPRLDLPVGL